MSDVTSSPDISGEAIEQAFYPAQLPEITEWQQRRDFVSIWVANLVTRQQAAWRDIRDTHFTSPSLPDDAVTYSDMRSSASMGGPHYHGTILERDSVELPGQFQALDALLNQTGEPDKLTISAISGKNGFDQITVVPSGLLTDVIRHSNKVSPRELLGLNGQHVFGGHGANKFLNFQTLEATDRVGIAIDYDFIGRSRIRDVNILGGMGSMPRRDLETLVTNPFTKHQFVAEVMEGVASLVTGAEDYQVTDWKELLESSAVRYEAAEQKFDSFVADDERFVVQLRATATDLPESLKIVLNDLGVGEQAFVIFERKSGSARPITLMPGNRTPANAGLTIGRFDSGEWKVNVIDSSPVPSNYGLPHEYLEGLGGRNLFYEMVFSDLVDLGALGQQKVLEIGRTAIQKPQ